MQQVYVGNLVPAAISIEDADKDAQAIDAHLLPAALLVGASLRGESHLLGIVLVIAAIAEVHWHLCPLSAWCPQSLEQRRLLIREVLGFLTCNRGGRIRESTGWGATGSAYSPSSIS